MKVLRDARHYYKITLNREDYSADVDNGSFAYRQITAEEFAIITARSIADSLYNDTYSSVSEYGTWGTNREFTFKTPGPYFYNIEGTLYAGTNATGQKPIVYGAERNWGAAGGNTSKPSTLTFTANQEFSIDYSGSVTIAGIF